MRRILSWLPCLLACAVPAFAQVPAGPEFQVNTYTTGEQRLPRVAVAPDGGFVVAWRSPGADDPSGDSVIRHYDQMGQPWWPEFRVNLYTTSEQFSPGIAIDRAGSAVVVWSSDGQDGSSYGSFGRRFSRGGVSLGPEFAVNSVTAGPQVPVSVATRRDRTFVVAFEGPDGGGQAPFPGGIFARIFDMNGEPAGPEFQVNTLTHGTQFDPDVAVLGDGGFVVSWTNEPTDPLSRDVFARRFSSTGIPVGADFLVNTYVAGPQWGASVVALPDGGFSIFWAGQFDVMGRRYDAGGQPAGPEFRVNGYTTGLQMHVAAGADEMGNVVVTWSDLERDGSSWGVFGQRLDEAGNPRGPEFQVNTYTTGYQQVPDVAVDEVGNFIVVWQTLQVPGPTAWEAMGRRFGGLRPTYAAADLSPTASSDGNGVFEPGETVIFHPVWRNVSDGQLSFAGALTQYTGPPGASYGIVDGTSAYPTLSSGDNGTGDGYVLSVSAPPIRPALHWDTVATEALTPESQGQRKRWTLHVGETFTDVPRASSFYRFVEALVHHGLTGGCGATTYCPTGLTTREQMAVLILVAKESAGYLPRACTTPVFGDVPASSPFCRWIEELARRGVVNGCGGGNYCPGDPVSREQMAVFVLRTLDPGLSPPACTTPVFGDVPASSPFCRWVEELARRGVATGCGGGNYCPTAPVTREQMSVFLAATFGLTLYGP